MAPDPAPLVLAEPTLEDREPPPPPPPASTVVLVAIESREVDGPRMGSVSPAYSVAAEVEAW